MSDKPRLLQGWPFARLTAEDWFELGELQHVVEDAAVTKAKELLAELRRSRQSTAQVIPLPLRR